MLSPDQLTGATLLNLVAGKNAQALYTYLIAILRDDLAHYPQHIGDRRGARRPRNKKISHAERLGEA